VRPLDDLLDRVGCRALLVVASSSRDPWLAPFLGRAQVNDCFLLAPRGARPRLGYLTPMERAEAAAAGVDFLTPEELDVERWSRDGAGPGELLGNVLSRALHLAELAPSRLAIAGCVSAGELHAATGVLAGEGWSFAPGEPVVAALRRRKSADQLEAVRRTAKGTCAAFRRVATLLAAAEASADGALSHGGAPVTVGRLRREVAAELLAHGLEEPEGNLVAPAEEGAIPHTAGSPERVVRRGESLVVDLYPRSGEAGAGLFADCTRTFCVGEPPEPLARAHAKVRESLELARGRALPGARGWSIQEAVCEHLAAAGYPTPVTDKGTERGYVHGLGHGIGFEVHEWPSFREHAGEEEGMLLIGDLFTLEPGLYEPETGFAVRLEDLHLLGPDGPEVLTPLPYELDPRGW